MTTKILIIIVGDQKILINKGDLKGIDLSALRVTAGGYAAVGDKLLHRLIMNPSVNEQIDHINKNTLDNRRCNLRLCSNSQNQMNRGMPKNNTSGFKGVDIDKRSKKRKYRVRITANNKVYYLGMFEEAAKAGAVYRKVAKRLHGEFVRFRDPEGAP